MDYLDERSLNSRLVTVDPLYGHIYVSDLEYQLVQTSIFKRLRRIRQLSFAQLVYPCANHTRFEHSLGTRYVCAKLCKCLSRNMEHVGLEAFKDNEKELVLLASLLHDIGHPAFSHSIESTIKPYAKKLNCPKNHEEATYNIITNNIPNGDSDIYILLKESGYLSKKDINLIANIAIGNVGEIKKSSLYLTDIITGDYGCDRIDYLKRDSYYAGTSYGNFEISDLFNNLKIIKYPDDQRRLTIQLDASRSGLDAASFLLLSRNYHFYRIVHQYIIRGANKVLSNLIKKYLTFLDTENKKKFIERLYYYYDDYLLLSHLMTLNLDEAKPLINRIKEIWNEDYYFLNQKSSYLRRLDDFSPTFRYLLYLISNYNKNEFEERCEGILKKQFNFDDIYVDLNINGASGIPSDVFVNPSIAMSNLSKEKRISSKLVYDKSPILFELSKLLAKTGTFSIYSSQLLDKIDYTGIFKMSLDLVRKINEDLSVIKKENVITTDFLLVLIYEMGNIFKNQDKYTKTLIAPGIPGISKLMFYLKQISDANSMLFKNWVDETKKKDFYLLDIEGSRPFYFNKQVLKDIFVLNGMEFVYINRTPIGFDRNGTKIDYIWDSIDKVYTIVDRWDFHLTSNGLHYIKNFLDKNIRSFYSSIIKKYIKEIKQSGNL